MNAAASFSSAPTSSPPLPITIAPCGCATRVTRRWPHHSTLSLLLLWPAGSMECGKLLVSRTAAVDVCRGRKRPVEGGHRMADEVPPGSLCWNVFARELVLILARRNLRLGHLDDRKDERGRPLVHQEKVRRLQRSLYTPKHLATLNPDEMRRVTEAFDLNPDE